MSTIYTKIHTEHIHILYNGNKEWLVWNQCMQYTWSIAPAKPATFVSPVIQTSYSVLPSPCKAPPGGRVWSLTCKYAVRERERERERERKRERERERERERKGGYQLQSECNQHTSSVNSVSGWTFISSRINLQSVSTPILQRVQGGKKWSCQNKGSTSMRAISTPLWITFKPLHSSQASLADYQVGYQLTCRCISPTSGKPPCRTTSPASPGALKSTSLVAEHEGRERTNTVMITYELALLGALKS